MNNKRSQFTTMNDKKGHNVVNDIEQLCYWNACLLHRSADIKYVYVTTRLAIKLQGYRVPLTVLNESDYHEGHEGLLWKIKCSTS